MYVPVSTKTKQSREQPTGTHPDNQEIPEIRSLGNVTTKKPQNTNKIKI